MFNIAIDGFMGSGKTTIAKVLAEKLNFKILDTGAIFRAIAYGYSKSGLGELTEAKANKFVKDCIVMVNFVGKDQHVWLNDEDVTPYLRTQEISQLASKISAFEQVRTKYLEIAKKFAEDFDCVMEGRDIGTVVMPNADVKFFMTANENTRAQRRFEDVVLKDKNAKLENVLSELRERDTRDSTRKIAPLKPCEDSVIIDNTNMTVDETVAFCMDIIEKKLKEKKKVNITIDGYVCSGKSTISKALARRLGFKVFDTGAVYRAIACAFDYMKLDENKIKESYIKKFADQINIKVEFIDGKQHDFVNGIDHTLYLRTERVSALSAKISPFPCIREKVLKLQRDFAKENDLVMEGRDIGSFVLPNADFKFFCTADEKVRAKRRYEQQLAMGNEVQFADVLQELRDRDFHDINREHGAIRILPDSIVIDTTNQSLEQSVEFCLNEMRKRGFKI